MYASGCILITFLYSFVSPSITVLCMKYPHPLSHPEIENINWRNAHKPRNINQSANKSEVSTEEWLLFEKESIAGAHRDLKQ